MEAAALVEPLLLLIVTVLFVLSPLLAATAVSGAGVPPWSPLVVAVSAGYLSTLADVLDQPMPRSAATFVLCVLLPARC